VKLEFPPGALRPIDASQMERASREARASERGRAILRFHDHPEPTQRMLNAVEPASYVRPHRHERPDKTEVFLVLAGRACLCRWSDAGELVEALEVSADGPCRGVEIPPRVWHSMVALEPGTVLFEFNEGPFATATHKVFADWAPAEGSDEGRAFHERLRARLSGSG
jgi:cupin fold WbuC family metalloprotein